MFCARAHKTENCRYDVIQFVVHKKKISKHVLEKYANCGGNHQDIAFKCPVKRKIKY